MTPEEIQQVRERCEKATPGPWLWSYDGEGYIISSPECFSYGDVVFIAHARTDVPALLARTEAMAAVVAAARAIDKALVARGSAWQPGLPLRDALAALDAQQAGEEHRG